MSASKFNFRPYRGVEDRNEKGQAVVAFVISTEKTVF